MLFSGKSKQSGYAAMFLLGGPERGVLSGVGALATQPLSGDCVERRRTTRYEIHAPVRFLWRNPSGSRHRGEGMTRDISPEGMFILSAICPPMDAVLQIEVKFPALEAGPALHVRTSGRVLRRDLITGAEVQGGFAAVCKAFALRSEK